MNKLQEYIKRLEECKKLNQEECWKEVEALLYKVICDEDFNITEFIYSNEFEEYRNNLNKYVGKEKAKEAVTIIEEK